MAADKKTTTKVEEPKTASVQAEATEKQETVKSEAAAAKKTVEKKAAEVKKAVEKKVDDTKKAVEKKAVEKKTAGRKTAEKKTDAKKTETKKAELKSEICLQFGGSEYRQDDLVKIAKDVWKHDLKQKIGDLTSVELYVKPEEHAVYYVMNKEFTGSFYI